MHTINPKNHHNNTSATWNEVTSLMATTQTETSQWTKRFSIGLCCFLILMSSIVLTTLIHQCGYSLGNSQQLKDAILCSIMQYLSLFLFHQHSYRWSPLHLPNFSPYDNYISSPPLQCATYIPHAPNTIYKAMRYCN